MLDCEQCGARFEWTRLRPGGVARRFCDECKHARSRESKRKHQVKAYYTKGGRFTRHGITAEEFVVLQETQNFACALCHKTDARLCIDHCHNTGRVRGLLCYACNTGLGQMRDDPELLERGAKYLRGQL